MCDLAVGEDGEATAAYERAMDRNPEHVTDGYGESGAEHQGITRVRHLFIVACAAVVSLIIGATAVAVISWLSTRPDPTVYALSPEQHSVLLLEADEKTRGFNTKAIVTLVKNGYEPVAQSVDHNTDEFYIILVKCSDGYLVCAKQIETSPDPVVYLGIPGELAENPASVRFIATQVRIDFPLGDGRVQRCVVYRGKVLIGEAGPVTYDLLKTLNALQGFAGEREFIDQSPDNDASFWECSPEEVG